MTHPGAGQEPPESAVPATAAVPPAGNPEPPAPPLADGTTHPLDPRFVQLERLSGGVTVLVLSFPVLVATLLVPFPGGPLPLVLAGAVFLAALWRYTWVWPALVHRHASYLVSRDGIEIRRGVWWRASVNVPRSRIQHIDVTQGPLERRYGLATLKIYTAGTAHAEVLLHGLAYGRAVEIRDHLVAGAVADAV